jgi:FADH2-dependent halogenase
MPKHQNYDAVVIGGGPGGSSVGTMLARAGRKVLIVEREKFPRFHIGESLLSVANDSFRKLGLHDTIRAMGFTSKWGAQFTSGCGTISRRADFTSSRELAQPDTFHVSRDQFDKLLLDHAREQGAEVVEECRVTSVEFRSDGVTLTLAQPDRTCQIAAGAVIDASGRSGFITQRLGLREPEPGLANVSIYSHFSGVTPAGDGVEQGDIRLVARADGGWFWLIPINSHLTSVGVVLPQMVFREKFALAGDGDARSQPESWLMCCIAETPAVAQMMVQASREWPVRVEKDFSYRTKAYAGDRWLAVGDAGSFLDPIFSTGVQIAIDSGIEAAEALDRALATGDLSRRSYRGFEKLQARRYHAYRRFVLGFYQPHFRDVFFHPTRNRRMFSAIVSVLGGIWRPSLTSRLLGHFFFAIVRLQQHLPLAPRVFSTPRAERDSARHHREAA